MKLHAIHRSSTLALACGSLMLAFGAAADEDKMQMMDTNKDGMITAAEHSAGARSMFDTLDSNGDGRVTDAEMDAAHTGAGGGSSGTAHKSSADKIKALDKDGDGALTSAEHEAGSRSMFAQMDTNGDGNLSAEELRAGHDKMRTEQSH